MAKPEGLRITHMVSSSDPQRGVDFVRNDGSIVPGPTFEEARIAIREGEEELKRIGEERRRKQPAFDPKSYYSPLI